MTLRTTSEAERDQAWACLARSSRDACQQLGHHIDPMCLPDELNACDATFAQHAVAHLAVLKAIADYHLGHLSSLGTMADEIYRHTAADLEHACDYEEGKSE